MYLPIIVTKKIESRLSFLIDWRRCKNSGIIQRKSVQRSYRDIEVRNEESMLPGFLELFYSRCEACSDARLCS